MKAKWIFGEKNSEFVEDKSIEGSNGWM